MEQAYYTTTLSNSSVAMLPSTYNRHPKIVQVYFIPKPLLGRQWVRQMNVIEYLFNSENTLLLKCSQCSMISLNTTYSPEAKLKAHIINSRL